jgi:hypothetical protein
LATACDAGAGEGLGTRGVATPAPVNIHAVRHSAVVESARQQWCAAITDGVTGAAAEAQDVGAAGRVRPRLRGRIIVARVSIGGRVVRRSNGRADQAPDDRTCDMAKYLVLIYGDEQTWAGRSAQESAANTERHNAFMAAAGTAVIGGNALQSSATATSLRADLDGRPAVTDGPFLETKEVLGGYYLLEAADLDEAIALARRIPEASAPASGVEIRPVREMG